MQALLLNSSSPDVIKVQKRLKELGFEPGNIDGKFGKKTQAALIKFQTYKGLKPDGIAGEKTIKALFPPIQEMFGAWIPNCDVDNPYKVLDSQQNIANAMKFLANIGCNVVFPVVWNKGYTLFRSTVMRKQRFTEIDPYFAAQSPKRDPLQDVINEARRVGIKVIPWFEYGFMSSFNKEDGGEILQKKPGWWALDQKQAKLKTYFPDRNNFYTWMNALNPEVQDFLLSLILEVVERYNVDGIQLDDHFGLPVAGSYDDKTKSNYRQQHNNQDPPQDIKDREWLKWRAGILTKFVTKIYNSVKQVQAKKHQDLMLSISPSVQPFSLNNFLQDSDEWVRLGVVDIIHPQIYRSDYSSYENEIRKIKNTFAAEYLKKFAPAIAFNANGKDISADDLKKIIALNRTSGMQGFAFFTHAGLRQNHDTIQAFLKPDLNLA